ncbi:MAG: hypothetical protein QM765_29295 [Myxococcales bacterium]
MPLDTNWTLLAIVEVDPSERVDCECRSCKRPVYKRIHIISFADGRLECWGGACFDRECGSPEAAGAKFRWGEGGQESRRLTAEERQLLVENRLRLLERFQQEDEARQRKEEAHRRELAEREAFQEQSRMREAARQAEADAPAQRDAALLAQATKTVHARLRSDGINPDLPGWRSYVNMQIEKELARLRKAGSADLFANLPPSKR